MSDRECLIRECVTANKGKFPEQCFESGVIFWRGERITIDEFSKFAKQYKGLVK